MSHIDNIQVISELPEGEQAKQDMKNAGWDGPGWYFWDGARPGWHGPFESKEQAEAAMAVYVSSL